MVVPRPASSTDCALCGEFVALPNYLIFHERLVCQDCIVAFTDEIWDLDRAYWQGIKRDKRRIRGKPRFRLVGR